MGELSWIFSAVQFDLLEDAFPRRAYHAEGKDSIIETDSDG